MATKTELEASVENLKADLKAAREAHTALNESFEALKRGETLPETPAQRRTAISMFEMVMAGPEAKLAKFKADLEENPAHAFSWGTENVQAAATLGVLKACHSALSAPESKATVHTLYQHALERVLHGARWPSRSTAPLSNLTAEMTTSAWAEVVEMLSGVR